VRTYFESFSRLTYGSIIGRLVPTKLADTYGPFTVMSQVCLLGGIFVTALWITAKSQSGIIAFSALYGLASGGITPLVSFPIALRERRQLNTEIGGRDGSKTSRGASHDPCPPRAWLHGSLFCSADQQPYRRCDCRCS
jgi:hypothetical protein